MTTRTAEGVWLTIAPRRNGLPGAIERASFVEQDDEPESRGAPSPSRVAWRLLGVATRDFGIVDDGARDLSQRDARGDWMVSCRTRLIDGGDGAGLTIGDGSDDAMLHWLRTGKVRNG